MAVIALILQEYFPHADLGKVIQMVLIHDLVEIYAGDTYCYDAAGLSDKAERETVSAQKLYSLLPPDQQARCMELWQEFETQATPEAQFACILDRIQPLLLQFSSGGKSWKEHNVCVEQVRQRNQITFAAAPPPIVDFVESLLQEACVRKYLKP